jgi:hypothetical protein
MNLEPPPDLRSLADVDAPEVTKAALRGFRRRLLVRFFWFAVTLTLVGVGVFYVAQLSRDDLASIDGTSDLWQPASYEVGSAHLVVLRAVRLGDDVGLHFVVSDPAALDDACFETDPIGVPLDHIVDRRGGCGGTVGEDWIILRPPPGNKLTVRVLVTSEGGQLPGTPLTKRAVLGFVTIDLRGLGS